MTTTAAIRSWMRCVGLAAGAAVSAYATYVGVSWLRYGRTGERVAGKEADPLLDQFMPEYEVVERHYVRVVAPADVTLSAAGDMDLFQSRIVRAIFRGRELLLRAKPNENVLPRSMLDQVKALGWGVLAETPGREIVLGAVTQPWTADVVFHALPPREFRSFQEQGFVKIAWTLRTQPIGATESIFRTETRAMATDPQARSKFRLYWSFVSPGIILIRRISLGLVKAEAERRARETARRPLAATLHRT